MWQLGSERIVGKQEVIERCRRKAAFNHAFEAPSNAD